MKLQTCPDLQQLQQFVEGTLSAQAEAIVEEHLSACESCQSKVEQNIESADWWQQARNSLRSSSVEMEADDLPHAPVDVLSLLGPTDDPEKIGRIAEYEVIGIIGRGGMGVVFKAFDPRLNRFVAIKMLLPHLAASGAARKRFAREGQAAAAVVDNYVLPIYAVSEWKDVPYLVTQYSRGTTLQKRVQSEGPLEVKEILRLGMQTARGLAAAHAQGLVHRDVKPSNILLDGSVERAMLTDFGLARAVDDASITRTGVIAGTPQYMSPEQARGGSVDARSDLFSLGCVLYFLCTGHPPFRADNSYAILRLITDEEPRSIREINPDVPAWLCSIVQKLMAKRAEDRYGSASEVADVLEECLAHVQQPTTVALPFDLQAKTCKTLHSSKLRRRTMLMLTTLTIATLIAVGMLPEKQASESSPATKAAPKSVTSSDVKQKAEVANSVAASRLVTTIPGLDYLKSDLKALLDLTSETEQRQWVHVQGYLDTVFEGVEKTRPMETQHVPSIGDGTTLFWVPLPEADDSFKIFKSNLESLGYLLQKQEQDVESLDLYRVESNPGGNEFGWIRIDLEEKLACFALTDRVEAMDALRDQIVAAKPVANPADCSLAIAMTNADHSAEAQEYRRRAFQSYRDQSIKDMAAKGKGVLPAQLNDWLTTTWLDEYQLLSAEGSKISARAVLDRSKPARANAEMTFTATAIPNTALAASLSQLASSHDTYATWPTAESSILSLRVNAPVSQLRQDKLQSLNNWFATELRKSLISLNEQDDTSKDAADQLATGCRQILSDVIQSGRCNAIIESSLIDGQLQWIGSMVVPKPRLMTELLPLMTKLQSENEVALNVRKVGNVDLHRVKITGRMQELLHSILQSDGQYYVGCDADKIWFACGPNALDSLVARIETLGPAQPRPDVFHLNARVGTLMAPLIRVYEQRSQQSGPADPQQRQTQKRLHRLLGDLKDSTTNHDDSLSINVHASDDALNATIKCDTGILRFFGKQIARFSSENFQ